MTKDNVIIYYDGDCPFCRNYVQYLRLETPTLINLRDNPHDTDHLSKMGYNLNGGMVVKLNNDYYYGAKAINILALISTQNDLFNKINKAIFSNKMASNILYPLLVMFRNMTLFILGKDKF